jgi:hypothetical protein
VPIFKNFRDQNLDNKQLSFCENALKLTYGNVEFKNFPGRTPDPLPRGGKAGQEDWKRGGEGEGGGRKGRVGREGLKEREGKESGEMEDGEGRGSVNRPMFQTDRCH